MKKLLFIAIIPLLLFNCTNSKKADQKEIITVSILPQKYFIEQIAGKEFTVNVMLPPGASPADFEPTPKQIQSLSNSTVYFYIGHLGFEKSWMKKFAETAGNVQYVSCSRGIDLLRNNKTHLNKGSAHNHESGTDPHIWTSPENVKTIARTMCTKLSEIYPDMTAAFEKNLEKFIARINELDNHIRHTLGEKENKSFIIYHPSLSYFAKDYHLKQIPVEFEGKEPGTAQMKALVDIALKDQISTVFIQSQFETSKAKTIAKEINARVETVDPLAENWLDEMYSITKKMEEALSK
ncbi:MAG: zinc ABC transporter substrate-binding protein [Prolixibacteraceae bacterium]|nr:zinc ABC transporter substrate-binding protein [Prolixibacteraceae bacterium]